MPKPNYIIVSGDIVSGFRFIGPFNSYDEAEEWVIRAGVAHCRIVQLLSK